MHCFLHVLSQVVFLSPCVHVCIRPQLVLHNTVPISFIFFAHITDCMLNAEFTIFEKPNILTTLLNIAIDYWVLLHLLTNRPEMINICFRLSLDTPGQDLHSTKCTLLVHPHLLFPVSTMSGSGKEGGRAYKCVLYVSDARSAVKQNGERIKMHSFFNDSFSVKEKKSSWQS